MIINVKVITNAKQNRVNPVRGQSSFTPLEKNFLTGRADCANSGFPVCRQGRKPSSALCDNNLRLKSAVLSNGVKEEGNNKYKVYLTSPPVEGRANRLLIEVLSDYFKVKKSSIRIISGILSKNKILELVDK